MERKGPNDLSIISYAEATEKLSLEEKVGQFFMPAAFINDTEEEIQALEDLVREGVVGGICFFHSRASAATNFEGKKKVVYNAGSYDLLRQRIERYQHAARYPLLMSIDAEWGLAMRIEETPQYPYAMTLGAMDDPLLVYETAKRIGQDCRTAGIHWNFAPVADINSNPDNPVIGYRSFGNKPEKVSMFSVAFSRGLQDAGILSCAKHFPGHGDTATDSHLHLPVISKSETDLDAEELIPFKALVKNKVDAVMVGHIALPRITDGTSVSASVSKQIIQGLLRKKLRYEGVVVSDALNMHSVSMAFPEKGSLEWEAFAAGTDVLCFSEHIREGLGRIIDMGEEKRIEDSFRRVWQLKEKAFQPSHEKFATLSTAGPYNKILSQNSLTLYRGEERTVHEFRQKGYFSISVGKEKGVEFHKCLGLKKGQFLNVTDKMDLAQIEQKIGNHSRVLLSLYLPKAKPQNMFGLENSRLEIIQNLLRKYDVVLYLFGNPYFLKHLPQDKISGIILVYQDLEGFENAAADHFLGHYEAKGQLPVSL